MIKCNILCLRRNFGTFLRSKSGCWSVSKWLESDLKTDAKALDVYFFIGKIQNVQTNQEKALHSLVNEGLREREDVPSLISQEEKLISNASSSFRNYFVVPKLTKTKSVAKKDASVNLDEERIE